MADQQPAETDPAALSAAEDLDEDRLRLDPLEEGMDPPEHWAQADKFGNTEREMREGEDLDHRLAEEEPDIQPDDTERGPQVLDESVDEENYDVETVAPEEPRHRRLTEAERDGTSADEAGGSIAEELRTPPER
jgi:hypothetical protein